MAERLIRESDILKNIDEWLETVGYATIGKNLSYYAELKGCIVDAPTIEAKPVVHGRWISKNNHGYEWIFVCSKCGYIDGYPFNDRHNYCPNCGAKMDEKEG